MNKRKEPPGDLSAIELMRIVPLREAARLAGMTPKSLKKHHADKFVRVTAGPFGRIGMRVRDALMIGDAETEK
jgi:hypothetical protein